jgi:hypothetical protein
MAHKRNARADDGLDLTGDPATSFGFDGVGPGADKPLSIV